MGTIPEGLAVDSSHESTFQTTHRPTMLRKVPGADD